MPCDRLENTLAKQLSALTEMGRAKGAETVFDGIVSPSGGKGPRYRIAGSGACHYELPAGWSLVSLCGEPAGGDASLTTLFPDAL